MTNRCIVCKSSYSKVVFDEFGIDVLQCSNCGHVYSSYNANQFYDGYFNYQDIEKGDQYWWNEAHQSMYNDFSNRFIANKNGKLLDVGCGLGYFVKHISLFPGWQVYGCEISEQAVNYAKNNLGLENIIPGKIENFTYPDGYFDMITLWDVIEHIPDPGPVLAKIHRLLKPEGVIFLHTPNVNVQLTKARLKRLLKGMNSKTHYLEAKDHVNLYSEKTISNVLYRNGFVDVVFMHLKPIQSISGSKNIILTRLKDIWAIASKVIYKISLNKINVGNLFVLARKNK